MTTRTKIRSCPALAPGLLCLVAAGCGTAAPVSTTGTPVAAAVATAPAPAVVEPSQPTFADAASARSAMVGSVVTVAPAKIVEDLDSLSKRLDLPMQFGKELLSALSGMGLFGDKAQFGAVWDRLDPNSPLAVVWVLPARSEAQGYCVALTFRDAAGARQTLDGMGTAGRRAEGLVERLLPEGATLWGGVKGRTLFVSGSPESLLLAGGLAEQAQASPPDGQAVVTVLPPALIAASGKTREALLAEAMSSMVQEIKSAPGFASPAAQRLANAFVAAVIRAGFDSASVRIVLEVGPSNGIVAKTEILPVAGSGFAALIAPRSPLSFDAKLPIRDDRTAVTAIGNLRGWLAYLATVLETTGPAGQTFRKEMDKYFDLTGQWSCALDMGPAEFSGLCSATLKEGTKPKAMLDAVVALTKAAQAWEGEIYGKKLSPLKVKRSRGVLEIEKKFEQPDLQARAMAEALAGGETIKSAFKVKDGRLVMASGRDARKMLGRYGKGGDLKGAPLVVDALALASGAEAMMSADVVSMALQMLKKAKDMPGAEVAVAATAMPGLAEMKAPVLYTLRSGSTLTAEFRVPLGSLENVAKVVRGLFGVVGASR